MPIVDDTPTEAQLRGQLAGFRRPGAGQDAEVPYVLGSGEYRVRLGDGLVESPDDLRAAGERVQRRVVDTFPRVPRNSAGLEVPRA
ncbi:hypothetical protein [Streptomyces sp. CFMR 7]|uniref:hypothetical protein n=1 Tax=Streptomyces sp. CFMR 7 TaxID=1649184 RepID=UPI0006AD3F6C|nr:hypothetical protein [Streptomyces sp. CFMR 7]ALC26916.1 hypothetical protein ABE83_07270 [Streptomyces sp. CFMR 7]